MSFGSILILIICFMAIFGTICEMFKGFDTITGLMFIGLWFSLIILTLLFNGVIK